MERIKLSEAINIDDEDFKQFAEKTSVPIFPQFHFDEVLNNIAYAFFHSTIKEKERMSVIINDSNNTEQLLFDLPIHDNLREMAKKQIDRMRIKETGVSGVHVCRVCGKKETIGYAIQKRANDEGASTKIVCLNSDCGAIRWQKN